jgi:kinetochore protein NNF1
VPSAVRNLHEQFTQKLGDVLRREFEGILEDRNVVASLNELDRLVEEGRRRKRRAEEEGGPRPVAPHTLPARQLYISHLAPSLAGYAAQLAERQEGLAAENAVLSSKILQQRKEIGLLLGGLEGVVRDLGGSVDALTGGGEEGEEELEKIREMAREAERKIRERAA